MVLNYAWSPEIKGDFEKWTLLGWAHKGVRTFEKLRHIPKDYVLVCSHFAPWWEPLRSWIADKRPWIEIEYGYWGLDLPRRTTRRVTYCGYHNTQMHSRPWSRSAMFFDPPHQAWKQSPGKYVLVIEPHGEIYRQRTGQELGQWKEQVQQIIRQHWQGDIAWRPKAGNKATRFARFRQQLEHAHAVVGERTMACAEACLLGVPAYTLDYTISSLLMGGIENLSNISYPSRDQWWDHVCWSQFTVDEFVSGQVGDLVERYQITKIA